MHLYVLLLHLYIGAGVGAGVVHLFFEEASQAASFP
jgi:hypothetical protein